MAGASLSLWFAGGFSTLEVELMFIEVENKLDTHSMLISSVMLRYIFGSIGIFYGNCKSPPATNIHLHLDLVSNFDKSYMFQIPSVLIGQPM